MTKSKRKANLLFVLLMIATILFSFIACDDSDDDSSSSDSSDSSGSIIEVSTESQLAAALKKSGVTVQLLNDIELTEAVTVTGADVILDLDGKTITSTVSSSDTNAAITITGSLTITGDGTMGETTGSVCLLYAYASASSLTIESGTFINQYGDDTTRTFIASKGSLIIKGGTFTTDYGRCLLSTAYGSVVIGGGTFSSDNYYLLHSQYSSVSITGGTFSGGPVYLSGCSVSITGGTFDCDSSVSLKLIDCEGLETGSSVEISGVTVDGGTYGIYLNETTAVISDSKIVDTSYLVYAKDCSVTIESGTYKNGHIYFNGAGYYLTINGGYFKSSESSDLFKAMGSSSAKAHIKIYGGTFSGYLVGKDSLALVYAYLYIYGGTFYIDFVYDYLGYIYCRDYINIFGGTFSSDPSDLLSSLYTCTKSNYMYTVSKL